MNRNHTRVYSERLRGTNPRPGRCTRAIGVGALLLLFAAGGGVSAQSDKKAAGFRFPAAATPLTIRSGGEAAFQVDAIVPAKNHIYVKHASEISLNILTTFKSASPGWAVVVDQAPKGKRYKDDFILPGRGTKSAGTYKLKIFETLGRDPGPELHRVKVEIETQMCNSQTNVCYRPATLEKELRIRINQPKARKAASPKQRGGVAWVQSYDQAVSRARSTGRNIFVVITAPDWCGYCKVLEARVFSKSAVASRLNQKFVPLQLLDSNSDRNKFNFDGYPTMLIAGKGGKRIAEVHGRDEASFLAAIRKYETKGDTDSGDDSGKAESYNFSIRLTGNFRKTGDGWERKTADGTIEKFTEHRRSKSFIILKNKATGQYVALPIKGGKGLIYRNSAWEPAFDVAKP